MHFRNNIYRSQLNRLNFRSCLKGICKLALRLYFELGDGVSLINNAYAYMESIMFSNNVKL